MQVVASQQKKSPGRIPGLFLRSPACLFSTELCAVEGRPQPIGHLKAAALTSGQLRPRATLHSDFVGPLSGQRRVVVEFSTTGRKIDRRNHRPIKVTSSRLVYDVVRRVYRVVRRRAARAECPIRRSRRSAARCE